MAWMNGVTKRAVAVVALAVVGCGAPPSDDCGAKAGDGTVSGFFRTCPTPEASPSRANTLLVTASGEDAARSGFGFPPSGAGGAPYFIDGWDVTFTRVLVTVANVTVSANPDRDPNDQSKSGDPVASAVGPWAVDLVKGGPIAAKEQNGTASPLIRLKTQNLVAGSPAFDGSQRYAFSYELAPAKSGAINVNLDEAGQAAYAAMATAGFAVLLEGTARWNGDLGSPACRTTNAAYDFGRFPKTVNFKLGFTSPVAFQNCVNPELQPAETRGVQTQSNAETIAQITLHLDHPFWESLSEDAPLRFDALAARRSVATGAGPATAEVTQADLTGLDFQAFTDAQGNAIPWRTCGPLRTGERTAGSVAYDPVSVPVNPAGGAAGLSGLADYMTYNLSTFGHLNNDGLCFPARGYPSPQ